MNLKELEKALEIYPEYLYRHYELRPCPFCYGKPIIDKRYEVDNVRSYCSARVFCSHCGASTLLFKNDYSGNVETWQIDPRIFRIYKDTNAVETAVKMWNGELEI